MADTAGVPARLAALRVEMEKEGLRAYLVPSTDAHNSEYLPECWQRRPFITGFTGSAGEAVVTDADAGLWTDSRYFLQAEKQLGGSGVRLFKTGLPDVPTLEAWLCDTLDKGDRVGVDPRVVSAERAKKLARDLGKGGLELTFVDRNLVDAVWTNRPSRPVAPVVPLEERFTGEPVEAKLARIRDALAGENADALVIASLDALAWTFNLRGSDVNYNPVFIAYGAVTDDEAVLFLDEAKTSDTVKDWLKDNVEIRPYEDAAAYVEGLAEKGKRFWLDDGATNRWIAERIGESVVHTAASPVTGFKARKNSTELNGFRRAHLEDGVAMVRFLKWLEEAVPGGDVTEMSAARKLLTFREEGEEFIGPSFPTISSFGPNGAIIHYSVSPESSLPVGTDSLYLVDSGGQYRWGTTDITRTLCFGEPTAAQRENYTRVLKGHIALTTLAFPKGLGGQHLEMAARRPLWEAGRNYLHGTGHGIGHYLNVHEGPVSFSPKSTVPLEAGNVISNEPGYYQNGEYGIRIENLVVVQEDETRSTESQPFLNLETLTLCPIATNLIERSLMTGDEADWLNAYHDRVRDALTPRLDNTAATWLAAKTQHI